ncbi:MAG: YdeI/OmpD-associated family protein [Bacteroidota bacterium]
MKKPESTEAYLAEAPDHWRPQLHELREILLEREELDEAIKWMFPVYALEKKHVASLFYSKDYVGLWFTQGALLSDPHERLVNASPEKTVAQRQLRFGREEPIEPGLVRDFLAQAIENQQMGLEIKSGPAPEAVVPDLLQKEFDADPALAAAYAAFAPYQQREFCESISGAKRADTKERRLAKVVAYIKAGEGLSDKYRK